MYREHHHRETGGELLEELQPRLVGHRDVADADSRPAAGQAGKGVAGGAEFGDHLQVGLQIEQLGKTGSDDLVIVDEGNFYHDVSLKFGAS